MFFFSGGKITGKYVFVCLVQVFSTVAAQTHKQFVSTRSPLNHNVQEN